MPNPRFDDPDLAASVAGLSAADIDALPFGVIRLDPQGVVRIYNAAERALSGSGSRPRLGLCFFTEVAPCMNNAGFRGRIERALAAGHLDVEFGWTGDFHDAERSFHVRAQSAGDGGCWIFLQRDED